MALMPNLTVVVDMAMRRSLERSRKEVGEHLDRIADLRVCLKGVIQQRDSLRESVRDLAARFRGIAEDGFASGSALAPAYEDAADRVAELLEVEP